MPLNEYLVEVEPVDAAAPLNSFLSPLKEHLAVPLTNGRTVAGMVALDQVAHREFPLQTKARSMAANTTRLELDVGPGDAARALLAARTRALPVFSGETYRGLVTERSLLAAPQLGSIERPLSEIANEPVRLRDSETVGKARSTMLGRHIGRLPLVDGQGRLAGLLEWVDFLDLPQAPLGRDERPRDGDSSPDYRVQASGISRRAPLTLPPGTPVAEGVERMRKVGTTCIVLTEQECPVGIVTAEDLLELLAARTPQAGAYIQITGAHDLDGFEVAKLHEHVDEGVAKVARIYEGLEFFYLHVKRYNAEGSRVKWSVRTRLATPVGVFHSRNHGFDLAEVVDEAMDKLERIVKESHERHRDRRRRESGRVSRMSETPPSHPSRTTARP